MKEIRINFVDFWPDLIKTDNYFYNILDQYYHIIIDENDPEILFFSLFGHDHLNYNCKKIFFTGENKRPNFYSCDFAFSFDYNEKKNHFRLPLYSLYINSNNREEVVFKSKSKEELINIWKKKNKFCAMVVSNPRAKERIAFFKRLSKIKQVDSGGGVLNNVGGRVKNKLEFINNYKFVFAFENEIYDGYTTEKILEPIFKHCIPIYWGNKLVHKDFNTKRFINYHDFKTEEDLFKRLFEIENNPQLALEIISEPILNFKKEDFLSQKQSVLNHIKKLHESNEKPVSKTLKSKIYSINVKLNYLKKKVFKKIKLS